MSQIKCHFLPEHCTVCPSCLCPGRICVVVRSEESRWRVGFQPQVCDLPVAWAWEPGAQVPCPPAFVAVKQGWVTKTVPVSWVKRTHIQRTWRKCLSHSKNSVSIFFFFNFAYLTMFFFFFPATFCMGAWVLCIYISGIYWIFYQGLC